MDPSVLSSMRSPVEDHKPRSLSMKPFLLAIRRRETLCSHEPVKYWMAGPQLVVSMNRKSIWIEDECRSSEDTVLPESTDRPDGPPLISPMAYRSSSIQWRIESFSFPSRSTLPWVVSMARTASSGGVIRISISCTLSCPRRREPAMLTLETDGRINAQKWLASGSAMDRGKFVSLGRLMGCPVFFSRVCMADSTVRRDVIATG